MESIISLFELLFEKAKNYSTTTVELIKLKIIEKTTSLASSVVILLVVFLFFMMFIIPFNVGIALFLGEVLGKLWYGFLIVSGFYFLVVILLVFFFRRALKRIIINFMIRKLMK